MPVISDHFLVHVCKVGSNARLKMTQTLTLMFIIYYSTVQEEIAKDRSVVLEEVYGSVTAQLTDLQQRAVSRVKNKKMSSWLDVIPVAKHHFNLSTQEGVQGRFSTLL